MEIWIWSKGIPFQNHHFQGSMLSSFGGVSTFCFPYLDMFSDFIVFSPREIKGWPLAETATAQSTPKRRLLRCHRRGGRTQYRTTCLVELQDQVLVGPLRIGLWVPIKMALVNGSWMGVTNHLLTGMILPVVKTTPALICLFDDWEKFQTCSTKWWFNGDLPWQNLKKKTLNKHSALTSLNDWSTHPPAETRALMETMVNKPFKRPDISGGVLLRGFLVD